MSQALYRKYRSRQLSEVLGQGHITSILARALEKGKIAHAYLLTGPRGVGKTSVARILAHEINQLPYEADNTHLDIIEIDAASNNGVDDIRALREKAQVAPVSAAKKIYIIDEVHMLSKPAFNALLKTLEEPPAHIVFILATTDADKLPATILSRVQQFYFRPITPEVIAGRLAEIAAAEGFAIDEAAARLIAEQSRGGFRDAISLLDQLSPLASSDEPLSEQSVAAHLGLTGQGVLEELIAAWHSGDALRALALLRQFETEGVDPVVLAKQLMQLLRQRLNTQPELVALIGQLIEVTRHPHPDLKLLTIFGAAYGAAQPAATPSAPEAVKRSRGADASAERSRSISSGDTSEKSTLVANGGVASRADSSAKPQRKAVRETSASEKAQEIQEAKPALFDWQALLDKVKAVTTPGRYGMLAKSGHQLDGRTLTIYAGNKLAAAKLGDATFRPQLAQLVQGLTGQELDITIRPDKKPPEDAQLAEIAAMMGGGEEVKLEDLS